MEKQLVPPDRGQAVAVIVFMLGLGMLLPWSFFITASQSSLFGLVGLFPPGYTTLFMGGQSLAGTFAAVAMLLSIISGADESTAAMGYFMAPCVATLGTLLCYLLLPRLKFAAFYLSRPQQDSMQSQELLSRDDPNSKNLQVGATVVRSPSGQEHLSVLAVFGKIWPMALCVTSVMAVTLSVFPVITVRVRTVHQDNVSWDKVFTCVCCFIVFNAVDLVGRGAVTVLQWPPRGGALVPAAVLARLVFIPLLMLCNVENSRLAVVFAHDGAFVAIMVGFAFSNGYLATLCMANAPQRLRGKDCGTAGSLMTFFLFLGLAVGAAFSFLLGSLV